MKSKMTTSRRDEDAEVDDKCCKKSSEGYPSHSDELDEHHTRDYIHDRSSNDHLCHDPVVAGERHEIGRD